MNEKKPYSLPDEAEKDHVAFAFRLWQLYPQKPPDSFKPLSPPALQPTALAARPGFGLSNFSSFVNVHQASIRVDGTESSCSVFSDLDAGCQRQKKALQAQLLNSFHSRKWPETHRTPFSFSYSCLCGHRKKRSGARNPRPQIPNSQMYPKLRTSSIELLALNLSLVVAFLLLGACQPPWFSPEPCLLVQRTPCGATLPAGRVGTKSPNVLKQESLKPFTLTLSSSCHPEKLQKGRAGGD